MQDNVLKAFVVLALNTGDEVAERLQLAKLGFVPKKLVGVYKGQEETSWLVVIKDDQDLHYLARLADLYDQESILHVREDRSAELIYTVAGKENEELGYFRSVSEYVAKNSDCYTLDPSTGIYWRAA